MSGPVEVETVAQWNAVLREAKAAERAVIADFHAEWCGPCKQIAPFYAKLATDHPAATWLRVDVDGAGTRLIAQKYKVSAMPTFVVIRNGSVAETLRGADPRALNALAAKYAAAKLDPDAEREKEAGNKAFAAGEYAQAIEYYSAAISREPKSATLYANRSIAYLKLAAQGDGEELRPKALGDARMATELDELWPKGWLRLAEAILASGDDVEEVVPEEREESKVQMLQGAQVALMNVVGLSAAGKVRSEAQKMLDGVQKRLQELGVSTECSRPCCGR